MNGRISLTVSVDAVAALRQMRGGRSPDPVFVALLAEQAGADGISMYLREDRRHVQDRDVFQYAELTQSRLDLRVAMTTSMLEVVKRVQPEHCCLVGQQAGGAVVDAVADESEVAVACESLRANGIRVALLLDPDRHQLDAAGRCGVAAVKIHTGHYTSADSVSRQREQLRRLADAAEHAAGLGLAVGAGGGLDYRNVGAIAALPAIDEIHVGHALVAQALWAGIPDSVREMRRLLRDARSVA